MEEDGREHARMLHEELARAVYVSGEERRRKVVSMPVCSMRTQTPDSEDDEVPFKVPEGVREGKQPPEQLALVLRACR